MPAAHWKLPFKVLVSTGELFSDDMSRRNLKEIRIFFNKIMMCVRGGVHCWPPINFKVLSQKPKREKREIAKSRAFFLLVKQKKINLEIRTENLEIYWRSLGGTFSTFCKSRDFLREYRTSLRYHGRWGVDLDATLRHRTWRKKRGEKSHRNSSFQALTPLDDWWWTPYNDRDRQQIRTYSTYVSSTRDKGEKTVILLSFRRPITPQTTNVD